MSHGDTEKLCILAPTMLEYWAVRAHRPSVPILLGGMGLSRLAGGWPDVPVLLCGLAGGASGNLPLGSIVIPEAAVTKDGTPLPSDEQLRSVLWRSARLLGYRPHGGTVLTAPRIVTGPARSEAARAGHAIVDMEAALLAGRRWATVRVVVDTPSHSLSARWADPLRAALDPGLCREFARLAVTAPLYAWRAGAIASLAAANAGTHRE